MAFVTLYERAVEPLDVVAVGVKYEDLVARDGDGQKESRADGDGEGDGAQPEADPEDGRFILVDGEVVLAVPPAKSGDQRVTRDVQEEEEQQEYLEEKNADGN